MKWIFVNDIENISVATLGIMLESETNNLTLCRIQWQWNWFNSTQPEMEDACRSQQCLFQIYFNAICQAFMD